MLPERLSNGCVPVKVFLDMFIKNEEIIEFKGKEYQYTITNAEIESITYWFVEKGKKIAINYTWSSNTINWKTAIYHSKDDLVSFYSRNYIAQKYQDIVKDIIEFKGTNILKLKKDLYAI